MVGKLSFGFRGILLCFHLVWLSFSLVQNHIGAGYGEHVNLLNGVCLFVIISYNSLHSYVLLGLLHFCIRSSIFKRISHADKETESDDHGILGVLFRLLSYTVNEFSV